MNASFNTLYILFKELITYFFKTKTGRRPQSYTFNLHILPHCLAVTGSQFDQISSTLFHKGVQQRKVLSGGAQCGAID